MKAITFHGTGDVRIEAVADPKIMEATDAVVRITAKMGICNARNFILPLMPLIQAGELRPARIITHTLPLADGPKGYAIFDKKEGRQLKSCSSLRTW